MILLMRHLKIALKIGIGYGIVCVLMTLVSIAVYLSGTGTTQSVEQIKEMVLFDVTVNDTKSAFYEARVYANVFLNNNSEDAYNEYAKASSNARSVIDSLSKMTESNELYKDATSEVKDFVSDFDTWTNNLEEVKVNYSSMDALNATIDETMFKAMESLAVILGNSSLSYEELVFVSETAVRLQAALNDAEQILSLGKVEYYDGVSQSIDEILATLTESKYASLVTTIGALRDYLKQYVVLLDANNEKKKLSHNIGEQALDGLDNVLHLAENFMDATIDTTKSTSEDATVLVMIISGASILLSMALAIFLAKKISDPLKRVRDRLQLIADTGRIRLSSEELETVRYDGTFRDEVGECNKALYGLIVTLSSLDDTLCEISNGNLSVEVDLLSDEDSMGKAMQQLVQSLNKTFSEVNGISSEIAGNAKDVSESSMSLAQGATEQTAAVAALGQSISKVAEKTLESARMAIDAAKLGDTIKHNAEIGTHQMEQMLDAVGQITEASASIGKVIKVIDDIAFQTNILALNAAVEAARAGQHGKGFAVVAEEVRNLAAKSAEAAKDTGSLIENSIQKADLGAKIATETSASLAEIVSGINESSKIVNVIAQSSENQTNAINEINRGIGQVGEVVHLISKGAELSSGASNSMREESDALHNFVSSYRLKDESGSRLLLGGK